jgi:hypothetical protein
MVALPGAPLELACSVTVGPGHGFGSALALGRHGKELVATHHPLK